MSDSPMSSSPYDVLGVAATASEDDLRRAYRRLLRETHPDTGGDPQRFIAVQTAWERIGSPDARAQYDRGRSPVGEPASWAPAPAARPAPPPPPAAAARPVPPPPPVRAAEPLRPEPPRPPPPAAPLPPTVAEGARKKVVVKKKGR